MNDPTPVAAADQQVLITRIFEAPRQQKFDGALTGRVPGAADALVSHLGKPDSPGAHDRKPCASSLRSR